MTTQHLTYPPFSRTMGVALLAFCLAGCDDDEPSTQEEAGTSPPVSDEELAKWPASYQEFISDVGGSKFASLGDTRMHYVEQGPSDGEVVLLIHGIPTHSFLWRKVMPHLEGKRTLAIDLIGYGRSDRPDDLEYTPQEQVEFLTQFVDELGLEDVHLVVQDLGGIVGMRWAAENPAMVGSITMFETLWSTIPSLESIAPPFGGEGGMLDQMRDPETGPTLVGEQNIFLNSLSDFTLGGVAEEDAASYRYPWPDAEERARIFRPSGPLAFPLEDNAEAAEFTRFFQNYLEDHDVPKLVINVTPGALSGALVPIDGDNGELVPQPEYAAAAFPNVTGLTLDGGVHFVQEDLGPELGDAISSFVDDVAESSSEN